MTAQLELNFDQSRNEDNILAYFQSGGTLTMLKALRLFRTSEIRVYVSRLRRRGHDIIGVWTTDYETGKHFKEFHLRTVRP